MGYLSVYCYILRVVYVFWILVPYQTRFPKIVSHSVYVFYFLDGASEVQINSDEVQFIYFFPLVACAKVFYFNEVQFIFSFILYAFGTIYMKPLPNASP